jgi:hypothetical protein
MIKKLLEAWGIKKMLDKLFGRNKKTDNPQ